MTTLTTEMLAYVHDCTRSADKHDLDGKKSCFVADMHKTAAFLGMFSGDLGEFKQALVRIWRTDGAHLTRCDLVGAYDQVTVDASEIVYMHATFHFVTM